MDLLILGGTKGIVGGVEAFSARAKIALQKHGNLQVELIETSSVYLTFAKLPAYLSSIVKVACLPRPAFGCVWIQYVNFPDLLYILIAKMRMWRVVVTPHLGGNWRSQSSPLLRQVSAWLMSFADSIALLSVSQAKEIKLPKHTEIQIIQTFLPVNDFPNLECCLNSSADIQLIHSCRLSVEKGTFLFLDVCERLREKGISFHARVVGQADKATLELICESIFERNLQSYVDVLGPLPNAELLAIMAKSDALVHLSKTDSYPLVVLESLACSVLPICIGLAGAKDIISVYDGVVVDVASSVDEAVNFLFCTHLGLIRERAERVAFRVRSDYEWAFCVSKLREVLFGGVQNSIMQ